jgi:hypothetical protein
MIWTFIKAFCRLQWAKMRGYEPIASRNIQDRRLNRCDICLYYEEGQCKICKCLVFAKAMLATEKCPKGFWGAVWIKKSRVTTP